MQNEILTRIQKRIEAFEKGYRQNIGLIGSQGLGKSHCLGKIYESLIGQGKFIPVYIDAPFDSFERLIDRWIGAICSGVFMSQAVQAPKHFPSLLNAAEPIIPKTLEKIHHLRRMLRKEPASAIIRELFSLTGVLEAETSKKIILLIDEFDRLENLPVQDPFSLLGKEIMVETNTLYLVASSRPERAKLIFREKLALLFSNFEVIEFNRLNFGEADQLLENLLESIHLSQSGRKFLLRLTDGNIGYLHRLAGQIKTAVQTNLYGSSVLLPEFFTELPPQFIWEALERELFQEFGSLKLLFEKKLDGIRVRSRDGADQVQILYALGYGCHQVSQIASFIGKKIHETKKLLQRALEMDEIRRSGSFFYLEDYLFAFWLRFHFDWQNQLFIPQHLFQESIVKQTIQKEYVREEGEDESSVIGRVMEFLKNFRGESAVFGEKKILFPSLTDVLQYDALSKHPLLLAKASRHFWALTVHFEPLKEEDIFEIQGVMKKLKKKIQQRVLIALRGIEQNAKLVASESKMQIWDLRDLNQMLYFYNLPKILMLPKKETHEPALGPLAESLYTA